MEAGIELATELAEPFDDESILLRHDDSRLEQNDDNYEDNRKCNN